MMNNSLELIKSQMIGNAILALKFGTIEDEDGIARHFRRFKEWERRSHPVYCYGCKQHFTNDIDHSDHLVYVRPAPGWEYDEGEWQCPEDGEVS